MSGSETGVMTSSSAFSVGLQQQKSVSTVQSQSQSQPQQLTIPNMRLAFSADGTAVYKPVASASASAATSPTYQPSSSAGPTVVVEGSAVGGGTMVNVNVSSIGGGSGSGSEPAKRKRGRPRKYGPDGTMALALIPTPQSSGGFSSPPPPSSSPAPPIPITPSGGSASPTSLKKARGRPPGSSKKQQLDALGSAGVGFTPHVITVKSGEDVSSKIMSFSQNGPRAVCVLSANGAISNVTLRQPATSGGTVTYEGRFEILSLSGSFLLSETAGQRSRTGGLSVSLSGPDGRVLGGGVAGLLTAASPVQVVVGSFIADGRKESKSANQMEHMIAPGGGHTGASSPPSRGTLSESSGGPGSPLNHSTGACNNNNAQGMSMSTMPWK